ncbi:DUF2000 domain-containing protein [Kibdelosporangium persicum]|uniref:DUF2000 domain-containing protein n=1 Tax=Kibdelosporangium persicum TaxID=2698649 RepID=A0ABX2FC82_9PSEU|nr:DUF2000 domain-containing protein [Kibdelosporangium persicum]NRN68978.1 hypothetical protein [Kibdelosporangium persicum]
MSIGAYGFAPDEIQLDESTRTARLKWVVIVDEAVPAGRMVNAVACIAASTGHSVTGMIGPEAPDAAGHVHPGLPWAGCTILRATAGQLAEIREKAVASEGVLVTDMPTIAQTTRVYREYMAALAETKPADLAACAIGIVGPRNRVSKLVKGLELLP